MCVRVVVVVVARQRLFGDTLALLPLSVISGTDAGIGMCLILYALHTWVVCCVSFFALGF